VKLTDAQVATLREMANYEAYFFRQATSRTLVALGLAEPCYEGRSKKQVKRPPHRITDAGRAALAEQKDRTNG
jgi:hypothetical protein